MLGPEVKWVEGARPLFRVRLRLISTVYTQVMITFHVYVGSMGFADVQFCYEEFI